MAAEPSARRLARHAATAPSAPARRCACSIDKIAEHLSYDEYVQAETVLRMQQVPSGDGRISMFRSSPWAQTMVDRLRTAQVEAEAKCF